MFDGKFFGIDIINDIGYILIGILIPEWIKEIIQSTFRRKSCILNPWQKTWLLSDYAILFSGPECYNNLYGETGAFKRFRGQAVDKKAKADWE